MKEKNKVQNEIPLLSSINPETSLITYKKISLMIPEIKALSKQSEKKLKNENQLKQKFVYDKYTNQFIYINGDVIVILDRKCHMKTFSRYKIEEEIKSITVDYNNKYMLLTTVDYKAMLISLDDSELIECNINKKWQYIGGFFIQHKRPEKKHSYFIVCLITKDNFNIKRVIKSKGILDNSFKYSNKSNYISNKMNIIDYDFNPIFKVLLIIKSNPISFYIFNLKSKNCYQVPIIISSINIKQNDYRLFLQQIYEKFYLIHLDNLNNINIHRLNNLKKNKNPRKIKYCKKKEKIPLKRIKVQFYNNLIILYMPYLIKIFDIKTNNQNFEVSIINISDDDYNILINAKVCSKYLLINDEYYKIKFMKLNYKKNSNSMTKEVFYTLLRRKNSNEIIKQMLFEYISTFKFWNFFEILEGIIINHKKFIVKSNQFIQDEKNNAYKILYIGHNQFFLSEDYLITLFNQYFDKKVRPEMLIKILCYLFFLYKRFHFDWNINLFYASLFGQLNKTDDFGLIEYVIKNKIIPINDKMAIYFIMRAKCFKDKEKYSKCFNLGFDILLNELKSDETNIKEIFDIINKNDDFMEIYEMILNFYFRSSLINK